MTTRIDVRKLRFRKIDGRNGDEMIVVSGLFDHNGNFLKAVSKKVDMRIKDETLATRLNGGVAVHADFKVAPGHYLVRMVVRDSEGPGSGDAEWIGRHPMKLLALGMLSVLASAQPPGIIRSESRLVLVDTVVTDKKGAYVSGLTQKDFRFSKTTKSRQ